MIHLLVEMKYFLTARKVVGVMLYLSTTKPYPTVELTDSLKACEAAARKYFCSPSIACLA